MEANQDGSKASAFKRIGTAWPHTVADDIQEFNSKDLDFLLICYHLRMTMACNTPRPSPINHPVLAASTRN